MLRPSSPRVARLRVVFTGLVLLFTVLVFTPRTQAYTVSRYTWPGTSTTYTLDSSFTIQGTGWANSANIAATNWGVTSSSPFSFSQNSGSVNHVTAGSISNPTKLAETLSYGGSNFH